MKSNIIIAFVFSFASSCASAEKAMSAPRTEEQCKISVEKTIDEHKALSNPADPNKVPDDSFVTNLRKLQASKGSCEAYNQLLDSYN
jgi:hypothetical protein